MTDPRIQDILPIIEGDTRLKQIHTIEPAALESIIEAALFGEFCDYWRAYAQLKEQAMTFVGWDALESELRTSRHYESIVTFIDWLLTYIGLPQIHQPADEDEQGSLCDDDWLIA